MAEPWRRRLRAQLLAALSRATGSPVDPLVRAGLAAATLGLRWSRHYRTTLDNLELAFGAELDLRERERIATGVRRHTARIVHEWLWMARAARSEADAERVGRWIDEAVELDASVGRLETQARSGRGVIAVTAHIGNWELLAARLARQGLEGAVIGLHKPNDPGADWLVATRAALRVPSLSQVDSARPALRVLSKGGVLGILCDLHARRLPSAPAPFFGVAAPTMLAPASLARASGLALTPVRCVREGRRYRLVVDEPLELSRELDRDAAALDLVTRLNAVYERWIRAHPEQWAWHQRRWPRA